MPASLHDLTAGLAGRRDPAQPLVTLLDGPARVELSGATAANWAAKTANLLVDSLGSPSRVGLLLPLHWQAVTLLLGAVTTGATVVLAREPGELAGCGAAFVTGEHAGDALDAGVDDVLAVSEHPLGLPLQGLPAMVLDAARELPVHGDLWTGPVAQSWHVEHDGVPLGPLPTSSLTAHDRVLVLPGAGPVAGLLVPLHAGAALVLAPHDPPVGRRLADEQVTAVVDAGGHPVHLPIAAEGAP